MPMQACARRPRGDQCDQILAGGVLVDDDISPTDLGAAVSVAARASGLCREARQTLGVSYGQRGE